MGGGNTSPNDFDADSFENRASQSRGRSLRQTAVNAVVDGVGAVKGSGPPEGVVPDNRYNGTSFKDSSMVDPDNVDEVEPGSPAVIDTEDGEVYGVVRATGKGDTLEISRPNGSAETLPIDGEGTTVQKVGDPSKMDDPGLHQFARNKMAVSPTFVGMDNQDYDMYTDAAQENVIDNLQDTKVATDLAESVETVLSGDFGASFCRGTDSGRTDLGISTNASKETVVHEFAHALSATYGFKDGSSITGAASRKKTPKQVAAATTTDIPDFGGEYRFGETTAEFDAFLLKDGNGYTPGETAAKVERSVAHASRDELVTNEVSQEYNSQAETIESISHSDVIEYESARGRTRVGMVTNKESGLGDDGYTKVTVQNFYDSDGEPLSSPEVGSPAVGEVALNPEQRETAGSVKGVVDKTATAEGRGVDTSSFSDTDEHVREENDAPDTVKGFIAATNEHWAKAAAHKEAGRDQLADTMMVRDGYSASNASETLAATVEGLQSVSLAKRNSVESASPELVDRTEDVIESRSMPSL